MPAIRGAKSKRKTRRFKALATADLGCGSDKSKQHMKLKSLTAEDLPGLGQWYCNECVKWFESETNFEAHKSGKPHKRALKAAQEGHFDQKEADAAIGLRTDNRRKSESTS